MPVIFYESCKILKEDERAKQVPERRPVVVFHKKPIYGDSGDITNQPCVIRFWLESGRFPKPNDVVRCHNCMADISWERADPSNTPYPALSSM